MAIRVFMPKAGMAMEEGIVLTWFKKVGDQVEEGEPLLEIETDKVNMELESPGSGVLLAILQDEGSVVEVTKTIGWLGQPGEEIPREDTGTHVYVTVGPGESGSVQTAVSINRESAAPQIQGRKPRATPAARRLAAEKGLNLAGITPSGASGEIKLRDVLGLAALSATPLAKKMAADLGMDLSLLRGSGLGGKITEQDILSASRSAPLQRSTGLTEQTALPRRIPLKGMRKRIAERMLQSHQEAPAVTLDVEADVTELLEYRKNLNARQNLKISFTDLLLKITAMALTAFPPINACLDGEEIVYHEVVNLGVAVALDNGLVVPVIRRAEKLSLAEIAQKADDLAVRARNGRLVPDDLGGGTFTVSNLGAYGIVSFTPILNPPEAGILGVCAVRDVVKPKGDSFEARKVMGLSLTFDHRVVDGAQGAIFLQKVVGLLENPHLLED